jgi:hypothetical protein
MSLVQAERAILGRPGKPLRPCSRRTRNIVGVWASIGRLRMAVRHGRQYHSSSSIRNGKVRRQLWHSVRVQAFQEEENDAGPAGEESRRPLPSHPN